LEEVGCVSQDGRLSSQAARRAWALLVSAAGTLARCRLRFRDGDRRTHADRAPEDVVAAATFLLTDDAAGVNAQVLHVNRGAF
jgi:hypothetical protein